MDPKEVIAGLDKETLKAIAQFGDEYMDYLWWKEIILPTIGDIFAAALMLAFIAFLICCLGSSAGKQSGS